MKEDPRIIMIQKWLDQYQVDEIRMYGVQRDAWLPDSRMKDAMALSQYHRNLSVVVINRDGSEVARFMNGAALVIPGGANL